MSFALAHLRSAWAVDQAIQAEHERVVCVRFGREHDSNCMQMDEVLFGSAELVKNFCLIYVVDIDEVQDFNSTYDLQDSVNLMFFFRNRHIQVDCGTGNNNRIDWPLGTKQEFIDICETVYRGAHKGRGLVVSPRDYSSRKTGGRGR